MKFKLLRIAKKIKLVFFIFSSFINTIINFILLSFVYIFGVGITSLFAKIFNKKFLDIKINKEAKTYWTNSVPAKKSTHDHYRQF